MKLVYTNKLKKEFFAILKNKKKIYTMISILALLCLFILIYSYLETRWIRIKNIEIKSVDLPKSFNNIKIVFISDIHHGPLFSIERVKSLVDKINLLKPDLIILGGDYAQRRSQMYVMPVFDELAKLEARIGIYAVLGNHDHHRNLKLVRQLMQRNGIKNCDNNSYWIKQGNDSIKIGGVGDLLEDIQIPERTTYDVKDRNFCILVSHNPDYINYLDSNLIDLTLSGHTHGGQVTFFGIWSPIIHSEYGQKYRYGLVKTGKMNSYITSGIGTVILPLRFFCRPEIVVITLKSVQ